MFYICGGLQLTLYAKILKNKRKSIKTKEMRTYIKINSSLRQEIMTMFEISRNSLYEHLNGLTRSKLSEEIRSYALAHGGQMVCETYMPACTTTKTSVGMAQTFDNGIVVLLDLGTSTARIMRGDEELAHYENVDINAWANILWLAQEFSLSTTIN